MIDDLHRSSLLPGKCLGLDVKIERSYSLTVVLYVSSGVISQKTLKGHLFIFSERQKESGISYFLEKKKWQTQHIFGKKETA